MPRIKFTSHLERFFPDLGEAEVEAKTVAGVISTLEERYPGLADYLVDERGRLRQHVNIFIGEELIQDRETLSDPVAADDEIYVLQALSGGSLG